MKFTWSTLVLAIILQVSKSQGDSVERRIIVSDKVPAPLAYYSQAVQVNNVLYISGNLGMTTNGDLVDGVTNQTKLALDNIGHILEAAGTTFDHVVKVTVLLSDIQDYGAMNDVYELYFQGKAPARTAFMATLPRDGKVEIDAVAIVGNIIDVDEKGNDAQRIVGVLPMLVLMQGFTVYRLLIS